jgi:hypothetical protein
MAHLHTVDINELKSKHEDYTISLNMENDKLKKIISIKCNELDE